MPQLNANKEWSSLTERPHQFVEIRISTLADILDKKITAEGRNEIIKSYTKYIVFLETLHRIKSNL